MSSTVGEEFSSPAQEKKLGLEKATCDGDMLDPSLNYGGASYDLVLKEGSAISSSITSPSESESESDFFVKTPVLQEVSPDFAGLQDNITKFDGVKDDMYKILLEKVGNYESELEIANKVIQTSQEEISRLKFEASCFDVTKFEDYENKISELQNTIAKLEVSLQESDESNAVLKKELSRTRERLESCENEVFEITHEMQHQINSTNEVVRALEADLGSERRTVSELQASIDASANHLSEMSVLQRKVDTAESRANLLEDHIRHSELEKIQMRDQFIADTNQLKTEVNVLNKSFDASKFKCDMVTAEKDELRAKLESLNAQVNCGSSQMQQLEGRIIELEEERRKLMGKVEDGERMATGLRLKVAKLENEAEMQRDVISDRAEEKREAIRQLCFSLEYYRSEYHQLCRAFGGPKRHPVVAPLS